MTAKETAAIEKLGEKVERLTVAVEKHIERCVACRSEVQQISTDIYGLPGNKEVSPGLIGDVADLRRSRRLILLALRAAWVLLTILIGATTTAVLRVNL